MDTKSLKQLEANLWEAADDLRSNSKLTSNEYCMPVLGLIFLRYAFSRFKRVEADLLVHQPTFAGVPIPLEEADFKEKNALYLPEEARYDFLVNLPEQIASAGVINEQGEPINTLGEMLDHAMKCIEGKAPSLQGILPQEYHQFKESLLRELLRLFNTDVLDDVGGDVIGRIYEYFLNKFAKNVAQDDGVFFTPKSLVKMIVNVLEPTHGILLDPACGSGGMFVQTGDFVNQEGMNANSTMTFKGQEKVEYNAHLCLMNMAVHGLSGKILSGDEANTFYHDAHHLEGQCDYVMANPPFNVNKVKAQAAIDAGRLPFGAPSVNKAKEISNANYLWISYFYAYLKPTGRAGFVMAASATDSRPDVTIRQKLVETGHVDVMIRVGGNFFYTKSLPCTLWFFDKGKKPELLDKTLMIDAQTYYTVVDRTLNEWSPWQLANLKAIVDLYRGETTKYTKFLGTYKEALVQGGEEIRKSLAYLYGYGLDKNVNAPSQWDSLLSAFSHINKVEEAYDQFPTLTQLEEKADHMVKEVIDVVGSLRGKKQREKLDEITSPKSGIRWTAYKKEMEAALADVKQAIGNVKDILTEAKWLTDKFGEGIYQDIPGLCKVVTREEIRNKNYSLTPGAYVGVAPEEDDGVDFHERMTEIHEELERLQKESDALMKKIQENWDSGDW